MDIQPPASAPHPPLFNVPRVTGLLLVVLAAVHLVRLWGLTPEQDQHWVLTLAFIPLRFRGLASHDPAVWGTLISYAVLHFGWAHIGMNLAGLAAFGSAVERTLGARRLLAVLLSGVVGGALLHFALFSDSPVILGGLSAGLSALFAVVIALLQHGRAVTGWRGLDAPAVTWIVLNVAIGLIGLPDSDGSVLAIAWVAHLGGFLTGLLWLPVFWPSYRFSKNLFLSSARGDRS